MPVSTGSPPNHTGSRTSLLLAVATALVVLGWLLAVFFTDTFGIIVFNPRAKTGFELFLALGQLFGALVLALSSLEPARPRIRWVAMALLVLGIGAFSFGYLIPLFMPGVNASVSLYGSILTRIFAAVLLAVGLVPPRVPALNRRWTIGVLTVGGIVTIFLVAIGGYLPALTETDSWELALEGGSGRSFPELTMWYHFIGGIPLVVSVVAVWGALRHRHEHLVGGWLVTGGVLFAGAQLHALFWPSGYSSILTTASVLRFAWTILVILGAIIELYALSRERSQLLAKEQERVRQLEDLNLLKRDFSAMVAHELGTPLAAIGNLAGMITTGVLSESDQRKAADRIQGEARILQLLVRDVQQSADIERDDFAVRPRPVSLESLIEDARSYAGMVRTTHPISLEHPEGLVVVADPERIGQVIRNLLNNAARHTPKGTPICLGAYRDEDGVCIEIADKGPGIEPDDHFRIFQKFGRGTHAGGDGRGLGLFLVQRILHAHGTELSVVSEPGKGASFRFRLEEAS